MELELTDLANEPNLNSEFSVHGLHVYIDVFGNILDNRNLEFHLFNISLVTSSLHYAVSPVELYLKISCFKLPIFSQYNSLFNPNICVTENTEIYAQTR